ncbi:MAG: class I tRNA ligase family protein, partial [Deltaproteobacteria bacterium]|nr:class I tRNA ligase family protein [Deltaproteobacteria bacterium]
KCQRCDSIVEPLLSKQWFVKTRPLADKVIAAVDAGKIEFQPENWKAEFYRWMRNIHDWCISRQLWWGHQIPAWTCVNDHITVARSTPAACGTCGSLGLAQDPDVLDTWFSSGLWPFSTFGWPEKTPQLATFYPNSVMETGFDILFFWVARMAMMGLHFLGEVPFKTVFLHAMVRDEKGEKMSKTRGNVIDPLDITSKYGADALRFTLASLAAQGRDIKLAVDRIQANKAFANKVWNAARYVLMYAEGHDANAPAAPATVYDRWILSRLQRCAEATNTALNEYRFSDAALGVYRFLWNELCDWAIELSKPALQAGKNEDGSPRALTAEEKRLKAGAVSSLLRALEGGLRLLHPFMPFVTEEIWQRLPKKAGAPVSIMVTEFPGRGKHDEALLDTAAESEMDLVARAIDGARSVRGEVNLPPNQAVPIVLVPKNAEVQKLFERHERAFQRLANATTVTLAGAGKGPKQAAVHVEPEVEVHLPLAGLIDFAEEGKRVEKELQRLAAEREGLEKRLGNEGFVARAPREVVEKDRARAEELRGRIEKLTRHRERVSSWETGMNGENKADGMNGHSGTQPAAAPAAPMAPAVEQVKHAAEEVGHKVAELASTVVHAAETGAKIAAEKAAEVAGEAMAAAKQAASDGAEKAQKAVKKAVAKGTSAAKKAAGKASKAIQAKAKPAKKAAKPAKKAAKKAAKPAKKAAKPAKKMAAKKGAAKKAAKPAKKAAKAKKPAKAAKKPAKKK